MNTDTCPNCGQRMLIRCGVKLSPKLADIFDAIERAKFRNGISAEVLGWMFYGDKAKKEREKCVAVNIYHLNTKLASTNIRVQMASRYGKYQVVTTNESISG